MVMLGLEVERVRFSKVSLERPKSKEERKHSKKWSKLTEQSVLDCRNLGSFKILWRKILSLSSNTLIFDINKHLMLVVLMKISHISSMAIGQLSEKKGKSSFRSPSLPRPLLFSLLINLLNTEKLYQEDRERDSIWLGQSIVTPTFIYSMTH